MIGRTDGRRGTCAGQHGARGDTLDTFAPMCFSQDSEQKSSVEPMLYRANRQRTERFCLFWQPIGVTISRRSAAADCADAQRLRQQCGERIACTFCASRTLC